MSDPSLNDPDFLLSTRSGMGEEDLERPVIIAVHGFTASTFEWKEFREYAEGDGSVLVSLVLLGGHGRSIDEFKRSTWREWGDPILAEYEALRAQGYRNVSVAASSTGAALVLEQLGRGHYGGENPPREFYFIDPLVIPGDKNLSLIPLLKHFVGNVVTQGTEEEAQHWYTNRPAEALAELHDLISHLRARLARGISLPDGSRATVYKTNRDRTADPVSALLIFRGLKGAEGASIGVQMFDSDLHVFTRLSGRDPATVRAADRTRQVQVFHEMIQRVERD